MGERAGEEVRALVHPSHDLWMTTVNLGEVWYSVARKKSTAAADDALELGGTGGYSHCACRLGDGVSGREIQSPSQNVIR